MAYVLILDHEPDACSLIKRIAEGMGHDAAVFTGEREAIAYGEDNRIDLAILDLRLKHMTGVEVLEVLKKHNAALKGLVLTGYPARERAGKAGRMRATTYLTSPLMLT